ncbi:hypothetical protein BS47DRAFT_1369568 [Hydnum rufescens UP504]|uniref:Uncharacterized protein n=1 Tax=Hydnum rufescens UP504 TaxID=1448309 RepID=A0A9P6DGG7_9AGAM|nr:hypothetical protein BS47DRAFT_1369568 [Hydnum rufescens UP504]
MKTQAASPPTKETCEQRDEPHTHYCTVLSQMKTEDPQSKPPHNDNTPAEGTPEQRHATQRDKPHTHFGGLSEPTTPPSKHMRTAMDPPNETHESSNPQHDDQALYRDLNPRPAKQHTHPSDDQPTRTEPSITTNTNEDPLCNPHPNDNMPVNNDAPNKDMGQCQNWYEPHTCHCRCVVLYKVLGSRLNYHQMKPPPFGNDNTLANGESQTNGDAQCKVQGPRTNHTPAEADFHLSLPPALTPKSKTHDPAEDSHENRHLRTPEMMPAGTKTVPYTHFSGIQIETPEMMTYPNGNPHPMVKCQATPPTTPAQADGTTPHKNKTELPN